MEPFLFLTSCLPQADILVFTSKNCLCFFCFLNLDLPVRKLIMEDEYHYDLNTKCPPHVLELNFCCCCSSLGAVLGDSGTYVEEVSHCRHAYEEFFFSLDLSSCPWMPWSELLRLSTCSLTWHSASPQPKAMEPDNQRLKPAWEKKKSFLP